MSHSFLDNINDKRPLCQMSQFWHLPRYQLIIIQIKDDNLATSAILQENIRKNGKKSNVISHVSRQGKRNRQWERKESLMILFNGLFWYLGTYRIIGWIQFWRSILIIVKSRPVDWSAIQFPAIFGVLLSETLY